MKKTTGPLRATNNDAIVYTVVEKKIQCYYLLASTIRI